MVYWLSLDVVEQRAEEEGRKTAVGRKGRPGEEEKWQREKRERRSGGEGRKEGRKARGRVEGDRGRDGPSRTGKGEGCLVTMDRGVRLFMAVPMRTIC